jgi:two-component system CheB/CheR fusion protein
LHTLVAADRYLKTHPGAARLELSSLLAPRLGAVVVSALHQCMREPAPVENGNETDNGVREFVAPETDTEHLVGVKVRPLLDSRGERRFALISFRDRQPSAPATESALTNIDIDQETQHQLQQMRQEVQIARENFQTTVEELETTNEELQATNEELMASGQEFETTGEQVRQDLASANEELIALTSEHQSRIDELNEANADLESLLSSTRQAVLFLDEQLQILRFSPGVAAFMHLMDRDIGRPIEHISGIFHDPEFLAGARLAASQGQSFERHLVSSDSKTTFRVKMHPYLCRPGKRGVVITFKNSEEERGTVSVQDLLDSLEGSVAVVKRSGEVERVNNAWRLLAADSLPAGRADWPGLNLLHCLRGWGDEACRAADGLIQALQDGLATSDWEYTRLQESERRSYRMTMRRLSSLAPGAIITHLDTTPARQIELV